MCTLSGHLLYFCPRRPITAGFHVEPMEAHRCNLREDPARSAVLRETALENDLILYLSGNELSHKVAYRSDPGGARCLDPWVEEAQGRAVFVGIRLTTQRTAWGNPNVHDGSPFQGQPKCHSPLNSCFVPSAAILVTSTSQAPTNCPKSMRCEASSGCGSPARRASIIELVSTLPPSQNPVGQRNLADEVARQKAQWERDEHSDDKFEQGVQRNRLEGIGKTHDHQGMEQVDRVDIGG